VLHYTVENPAERWLRVRLARRRTMAAPSTLPPLPASAQPGE
jgi:hypothetical protein